MVSKRLLRITLTAIPEGRNARFSLASRFMGKRGRPRTRFDPDGERERLRKRLQYLRTKIISRKQPRRHIEGQPEETIILEGKRNSFSGKIQAWQVEIKEAKEFADEANQMYTKLVARENYKEAIRFLNLVRGFLRLRLMAHREADLDELRELLRQIEARE